MTTAFISHHDCLNHLTPANHPESRNRLKIIFDRLDEPRFSSLLKLKAPLGKIRDIKRVHTVKYINKLRKLNPEQNILPIDADTYTSKGSYRAALRGVGSITKAIDFVMSGRVTNAFCATRPPGHHAEKNKAMGFCLFGNVAIGAKYALQTYGLDRVAIIDFDVHHGNGTQNLLWDEPRTLFFSSHQNPLFPGSGLSSEKGRHNNIVNYPLEPNTDGLFFIEILRKKIIPQIYVFKPQLIILSAGFDAHIKDPLSNLNWETDDYKLLTKLILEVAEKTCNNRVVSFLEGGYNLDALGDCAVAHLKVLMEA